MASGSVEKTAEELRKEIDELNRQRWEITKRLRDPRGLRRPAPSVGPTGPRKRGAVVGPAVEDQPAPKRRLSSAVVKLEDGEIKEDASGPKDSKEEHISEVAAVPTGENGKPRPNPQINSGSRRDGNPWMRKMDYDVIPTEPIPRILPKNEDPRLVKRNRRMLGQLLGTLEKFQEEDKQRSTTEAYMRRSDSLRRAEEKAREESERLRQQEREQIAEKRRRDLTLQARVAAKAEQKKMELLFILWSEHHKNLTNFLRTKTEPPIYYMPAKPLVEDAAIVEQSTEQVFLEWKTARRAELSEYQKQIEEDYISNVDKELDRWQDARNTRRSNIQVNLQETMDKELETHRLEHGPKPRRITGNNEEEDVEDIAAEDELMDEVLGAPERVYGDASKLPEAGNGSSNPVEMQLEGCNRAI
ncbi:pinin-like isoform X1 [Asparagus officinalis]|uniref:pinin-like isoform X1 n=1 Tax=Asparagus officinalis TaxID=4686 RepID=UPI00098E7948|nr:pinin-like isoform X1 [Asparagus officinalis]